MMYGREGESTGLTTLVMGGTNYFGKRLVRRLLDAGCSVTVATRGLTPDDFGVAVERARFERTSAESMRQAFGSRYFDVVFDQIGFAPDDIADAIEIFRGRIGKYVFVSSMAVYGPGGGLTEEAFDPLSIEPRRGRRPPIPYAEGKRYAEAYLFQFAPFDAAVARFPIVVGPDDHTSRLQNHVGRVMRGEPIVVPERSGRQNFIEVGDAGRFLAWLGRGGRTGPYNGASRQTLDARELTKRIGRILGTEPVLLEEGPEAALSEYALDHDWSLDVTKAESEGFQFAPFDEWFPRVVLETAELLRRGGTWKKMWWGK